MAKTAFIKPAAAPLLALLLAATAAAEVFVVSPLLPLSQISDAVALASDGDVILVRPGTYGRVEVIGKSLAIVAEVGANVRIEGGIAVRDLPAGGSVLLDRLTSVGVHPLGDQRFGLLVSSCLGAVRVQQCILEGASGNASIDRGQADCEITGFKHGGDAVRCNAVSDVAFTQCVLIGGSGSAIWNAKCLFSSYPDMVGGRGGAGLHATASKLSLHDTQASGGASGNGGQSDQAGHGVVADASTVVLVDVDATGGAGGNSFDATAPVGGKGGNGLRILGGGEAALLQSAFLGGLDGWDYGGAGGTTAPAIGGTGSPTVWSGSKKSLGFFKLLREGQTTPVQLAGVPGDTALLFLSLAPGWFLSHQHKGSLALDAGALLGPYVLGAMPSGALSLQLTAPELPAGLDAVQLHLQALLTGPGGSGLTSAGQLTLISSLH